MLTAYRLAQDQLLGTAIEPGDPLPPDTLWLDLVGGSPAKREHLAGLTGLAIPSAEAVEEIEATSRFFEDRTGVHLRSSFLRVAVRPARHVTIAFILTSDRLVTLRDGPLASFESVQESDKPPRDAAEVLLRLFGAQIDQVADSLEGIHANLEVLNTEVFVQEEGTDLQQAMRDLAASQDLNDKVRLSLFDQRRALSFLTRIGCCSGTHKHMIKEIQRDIESLDSHSKFVFEKIGFLVDAIRGQINLQENSVLKRLSLMGAALLPPTLIAAIYGMNFAHMPELEWPLGYPLALLLMLVAALVPVAIFKRKKWI